jgi:putative hydrolase of the HAD superfamily
VAGGPVAVKDLRPVRAVLFDAGNTLVSIDARRLSDILRTVGGETDVDLIRQAELRARRSLHHAIQDGHVGTEHSVWHGYFKELFRFCGVPPDKMGQAGQELRDQHGRHHLWTGVQEGATEVLEALRAEGYRLAVISNADGRIQALLEEVGLLPHFEFVIDSEVVGVEKPDSEIFLEGCRRLDLPPGECLYVGDLYPVDYVGARVTGLQAVLLDPLALYGQKADTIAGLRDLPGYLAERRG